MSKSIAIVRVVLKRRGGKILLLKRSKCSRHNPGRWEFPGGGMGLSESLTEALRREVREETGLDVASGLPVSYFPVRSSEPVLWSRFSWYSELYGAHSCVISDERKISLSTDHEDFGFFTVEEARNCFLTPSAEAALSDRRLFLGTRR